MAEPNSSSLPMLAAGETAAVDNTNNAPIKHSSNFTRRFPSAHAPTEGSKQPRGGQRPAFRGRRHDQSRQNGRPLTDRLPSEPTRLEKPNDVRNNLNDGPPVNRKTLSENHASPSSQAAQARRQPDRSDHHQFRRGFPQSGNRSPRTARERTAEASESVPHNHRPHADWRDDQHRRARGSRNWPRVPRPPNAPASAENRAQLDAKDDGTTSRPRPVDSDRTSDVSAVQPPRESNPNRGRPHRRYRGRGSGRARGSAVRPSETAPQTETPAQSETTPLSSTVETDPATKPLNAGQVTQKVFTPEELVELRLREIHQFKTRFPKADCASGDTYLFTFSPTDPDWAFDVRSINLSVQFPPDYPLTSFCIVVVNADEVLPPELVSDTDAAIIKWIEFFHKPGQLAFRPFLRWIDRHLKEIFTESLRNILKKREQERQVSLVSADFDDLISSDVGEDTSAVKECTDDRPESEAQNAVAWPMKVLPKKQKRLEELDDLFDEVVKPKPEVQKVSSQGPVGTNQLAKIFNNYDPHTPPRRGIEVKFRHVDFSESVAFVVCDRLLVSVQCKKCKKIADFQLLPGRRSVSQCAKCQTKLEACFGPSILLQFNPLLGYLELKECTIRDVALSRCHFYADCQNCSKLTPLEGVHLGQRGSSHCLNCNVKMTFVMDSFKYMDLCAVEANIKASNLKKTNKDSAIQSGKPLPSNGACKHYKKSFRWFRFPCCGKAYPCDVCHDTAEDHEAEFASRMICGFCAKEQPFSNDKPCAQCSNLITGRRTAHWEGGKGCRNQLKMNTNDTKKYAGLNKTVSRKSTGKAK